MTLILGGQGFLEKMLKITSDGKNFIIHNLYPETDTSKYGFVKMFEIKGK